MINIINKRDLLRTGAVHIDGYYVGRPSILGNPFPASDESQRDEVIEKYRVWLRQEYCKKGAVYTELHILADKHKRGEDINLICWCAPKRCHAEIIRDAIIKISERG